MQYHHFATGPPTRKRRSVDAQRGHHPTPGALTIPCFLPLPNRMAEIDPRKTKHRKHYQQQRPPPLNPGRLLNRHS